MRAAEIDARARVYLTDHPELHWVALERACTLGLISSDDRDTLLALLNLAKYFCEGSDQKTESTKSGTENTGDFLALKG
jgi:hypothetical protein